MIVIDKYFDTSRSFFFFQAEDGIRDRNVTGVQTCALPISHRQGLRRRPPGAHPDGRRDGWPSREADRKSVVEGKSVDLGGRRIMKKKKVRQGGMGGGALGVPREGAEGYVLRGVP